MKISNLPQATVITSEDLFVIVDGISPSEKQTKKITAADLSSYLVGQVPSSIYEYSNYESFPSEGSAGRLYLDLDNNVIYRWDVFDNQYIQISSSGFSSDNLSIINSTISSTNNNNLILNSSTGKFTQSSNNSNAKKHTFILKNTTTNLQSKSLTLDGSSVNINNALVMPAKSTWNYNINISAYSNDEYSAIFNIRGGAQTTTSGTVSLISDYLEEDWKSEYLENCSILINPVIVTGPGIVSSYLDVVVTGVSGKTIQWNAVVEICEMIFE